MRTVFWIYLCLAALLVLTLGWKFTIRPDNPRDLSEQVAEFLARQQFAVSRTNQIINEMPVLYATSKNCRLLIAKGILMRDSVAQVEYLTHENDRIFLVFRGTLYNKQPLLLSTAKAVPG